MEFEQKGELGLGTDDVTELLAARLGCAIPVPAHSRSLMDKELDTRLIPFDFGLIKDQYYYIKHSLSDLDSIIQSYQSQESDLWGNFLPPQPQVIHESPFHTINEKD